MKDLLGKKALGFKFLGSPVFTPEMVKFIGKEGIIISAYNKVCKIQFGCGRVWSYPYPEILDHLVDERSLEELVSDIKKLNSELWNTKT